ncbi:MAG: HTH domain-containing protein, partial [Bacillota bacterium]
MWYDNLNINTLAEEYSISRQSVYRYLRTLKENDIIPKDPDTNKYALVEQTLGKTYRNDNLHEDTVWPKDIRPFLTGTTKPAMEILEY